MLLVVACGSLAIATLLYVFWVTPEPMAVKSHQEREREVAVRVAEGQVRKTAAGANARAPVDFPGWVDNADLHPTSPLSLRRQPRLYGEMQHRGDG